MIIAASIELPTSCNCVNGEGLEDSSDGSEDTGPLDVEDDALEFEHLQLSSSVSTCGRKDIRGEVGDISDIGDEGG